MNQDDIFYKLINKGELKLSGVDKDMNSYRVIKLNDMIFKVTLEVQDE